MLTNTRDGVGLMKKILIINVLLFLPILVFGRSISFIANDQHQGSSVTIAAVGDILMHETLQRKAAKDGFSSLWEQVIPYLKKADITYGNLEGPIAQGVSKTGKLVEDPGHRYDNYVYSSYPKFNAHPNLAEALKTSGFNIVSFANNHSLDRYGIGVDRTIENLNDVGVQSVGARKSSEKHPWYLITHKKNISIAWIACTQDTNGIKDTHGQILYCYKRDDQKQLLADIKMLKAKVDAIIVLPHWGIQYQQKPSQQQIHFAHKVLNAGALVVIGNHPHCLQPIEKYTTKDDRETLIAYSLGNFVSFQGTPKNRATVVLYIHLKKINRRIKISGVRYLPLYMQNRSGINKLKLVVLNKKDKGSIGYRIITKILPKGNIVRLQ